MVRKKDKVGEVYGDFRIISREEPRNKQTTWLAKCINCGDEKLILDSNLRTSRPNRCMKCKQKAKDLSGQKIGEWEVLKPAKPHTNGSARWECRCTLCGELYLVYDYQLRTGGSTKCARCNLFERNFKHGQTNTRLYSIWSSMKGRTKYKQHPFYKNYGGRGISVCDEWANDFNSFMEWAIKAGYSDDLTIYRIDNNKDYCPENCRWISRSDQSYNKRTKNKSGYKGVIGKKGNSYSAIGPNRKYIGSYPTAVAAALARDAYLIKTNQLSETNGNFVAMQKLETKNM
jgi:hypothetical protein